MDDKQEKSCWGVTAKAVIGFVTVMALTWLIGGSEHASVLASAAG